MGRTARHNYTILKMMRTLKTYAKKTGLKRVKGVTERLFTYIMIYKGVGAKRMKDVAYTNKQK